MDGDVLASLPVELIDGIVFYKRDQITDDLICCDVSSEGQVWTFHEDLKGWDNLIEHFHRLEGFKVDWFDCVSQPPFEVSETIAFTRS
ncbi:hypothetical protein GRI89_17275 [Altererythrobacter salegens]|uniref:Uncharacterized protein n=1 Tax=Croceibacterium salegens TaxID=1737568 RepID=A0A6I4T128_9SPHN|nr:hypothetical protein [Croceibacterium salegens]